MMVAIGAGAARGDAAPDAFPGVDDAANAARTGDAR
jgi:hypothetical protein